MYNSQILNDRIKNCASSKKQNVKDILLSCNLNINTINQMTDKKGISSFSLAKIADELDCSVDYLLGRTNNPTSHKDQSTNTVNGNYNAVDNSNVTVNTPILDNHQKLLIELYNKLSPIEQVELIAQLNKTSK